MARWAVDLYEFTDQGERLDARWIEATDEAVVNRMRTVRLSERLGAVVYRWSPGWGPPTPIPGRVVVQQQ